MVTFSVVENRPRCRRFSYWCDIGNRSRVTKLICCFATSSLSTLDPSSASLRDMPALFDSPRTPSSWCASQTSAIEKRLRCRRLSIAVRDGGIEPPTSVWKTDVIPFNQPRNFLCRLHPQGPHRSVVWVYSGVTILARNIQRGKCPRGLKK